MPQGKTFGFDLTASSKYYPVAKSTTTVYVPAQYTPDKPTCLCVGLDGPNYLPQTVFDNLIFRKQMPIRVGVCAWTAAWQRPDLFRRIFLQDGAQDTWNPLFDNWYTQNRSMEESLSFAGYDVAVHGIAPASAPVSLPPFGGG